MVKLKLSSFFMKRNPSQQCKVISRKLKRNQNHKRKQKAIDSNMCSNNQTLGDNADINKLADELLVHILSRMSLKEAARTSVLAHRWKYLWRSVFGTLQFDFRDVVTANGDLIEVEKFVSRVNTVLELHQGRYIEGMVIMFEGMQEGQYEMTRGIARAIDNWVYFAVQKEVERFELCLSAHHKYDFPSIEMLKSHSHGGICSPFRHVRVLRLVKVSIKDEAVHYFLASCANLKELCIWYSANIKNLRVIDPPSLRVLEIKECRDLQNLEISAESLVSLAFDQGYENGILLLNRVPNLLEFTIGEFSFMDFILDPNSSYSDQLVKLVVVVERLVCCRTLAGVPDLLPRFSSLKRLEVKHCSVVARSLLFFTSLIKASPQLCEFRIEMSYNTGYYFLDRENMPIPAIRAEEAAKFNHTSLKVVEMCGYVGSVSEEELLLELLNNCASSIERVVIDTESEYYDDPELAAYISFERGFIPLLREQGAITRTESKERAKHFEGHLVETEEQDQCHQKKGVFPLDHMHLCNLEKKEYISCLKSEGHKSEKCIQFSKKLECRMEKKRMKMEVQRVNKGRHTVDTKN